MGTRLDNLGTILAVAFSAQTVPLAPRVTIIELATTTLLVELAAEGCGGLALEPLVQPLGLLALGSLRSERGGDL